MNNRVDKELYNTRHAHIRLDEIEVDNHNSLEDASYNKDKYSRNNYKHFQTLHNGYTNSRLIHRSNIPQVGDK